MVYVLISHFRLLQETILRLWEQCPTGDQGSKPPEMVTQLFRSCRSFPSQEKEYFGQESRIKPWHFCLKLDQTIWNTLTDAPGAPPRISPIPSPALAPVHTEGFTGDSNNGNNIAPINNPYANAHFCIVLLGCFYRRSNLFTFGIENVV